MRYTSEPEGPSQPGNVQKISLERIFDKLKLDVIIDKLKGEAGGSLGGGEVEVSLPAQIFPYLRLLMESFAASIPRDDETGEIGSSIALPLVREVVQAVNPGLGFWLEGCGGKRGRGSGSGASGPRVRCAGVVV